MRLGLVGYTNLNSGIGVFIWEYFHYLNGDSILSVSSVKGEQQVWTDRQLNTQRPPSGRWITKYLEEFEPTVVMFIETPFNQALYPLAKQYGAKTVSISMHETAVSARLRSDLLICPSVSAWEKAPDINREFLFMPIGLHLFPFKKRTGHMFLFNIGYGGPLDRRQSATVIEAFRGLQDPDARMIVNSQVNFPGRQEDPRIEYRLQNFDSPGECYSEGDIYIAPTAYDGYGRPILESMASGMPCLTTNADPMNLFQHDPDFLIEPVNRQVIHNMYVENTVFNQVSVESVRAKMEWLLTIDTGKYSERARRQAEVQSWESECYDFKSIWLDVIENG